MRCLPLWLVSALALVGAAGCKDPETAARQAKQQTASDKLAEGQALLLEGRYRPALEAFQVASAALPDDPTPYLHIADAQRQLGNDTAAILALKRADELSADKGPELKKQLAGIYQRAGHSKQAIAVLGALLKENLLADPEILALARLQAREGDVDTAFKTLEHIQRERPDDPAAKVLEAEILLLDGEEQLAANLMDRLVSGSVLPEAWLLRARYFLNNGHPSLAEADLGHITGEAAERAEVFALRARVLNALKRHDEAESVLRALVARHPNDPDAIAQLAETKLLQGRAAEAEPLIEKALALRPGFARALYVRARALEAQNDLHGATQAHRQALKADPSFAPALSRIWRIQAQSGEKTEAMATLERLYFMGEASIEERVSLAELYADLRVQVDRGIKLISDALRKEPQNLRYLEVKQKLQKAGARTRVKRGPVILRGGR
ncbi:MAG: tetratricopeptide repeat protein [Myxococcaceae bacterium]